jgi:hypothetical protein
MLQYPETDVNYFHCLLNYFPYMPKYYAT